MSEPFECYTCDGKGLDYGETYVQCGGSGEICEGCRSGTEFCHCDNEKDDA